MSASVRSSVPEIAWPAWPDPANAELLGLYYQLASSEWWPRRRLLASQLDQAEMLIDYARSAVPFYRDRLPRQGARLTLERFRDIPIVRRSDIQSAGTSLFAREVPPGHGPAREVQTSGSSGHPLRTRMTRVTGLIGQAMTVRTARWHALDLSFRMASIRPVASGESTELRENSELRWLPAFESGDLVMLDPRAPAAEQLDWLMRHSPCYLQTSPSVLAGLARAARGGPVPRIPRVLTSGEILEPGVRESCREVLRAEIVDCYSAIECGLLALQCPQSGRYHVMAESALLEVLDDQGRPCRPGTVGTVVVTVLHNFAMPLIRYGLGDLAEVGAPCSCGRGLPTLERIVGRARSPA